MTTATLERERLSQIIQDLPDDKVMTVLDLIEDLMAVDDIDNYEPNAETIAALLESEDIEKLPTYDTVQDMFDALGVKC
ncbi:hypothetical protein AGMMS50276_28440 [Synergistales bacterium]|nr:hypothetical protein AGMMS50276_28440 [Synergistales bacterium]